jgi:SAM-dependent methyltransferase
MKVIHMISNDNLDFYGHANWDSILRCLLQQPEIKDYLIQECNYYDSQIAKDRKNLARYRFLDIGCGTGRVISSLSSLKQNEAVGIDVSFKSIAICKKRLPEQYFVVADAKTTPFTDNAFDCVGLPYSFLGNITHEERGYAITEIARIIKPGGLLLLSTYSDKAAKTQEEAYSLIPGNKSIHSSGRYTFATHNGIPFRSERFSLDELKDILSPVAVRDMACSEGPIYILCSVRVKK